MKAQVIQSFGGCDVFELVDVPKPQVKEGYVLIRVEATSVNPVDCKVRSGIHKEIAPHSPSILHSDVAGVIEEVGAGVSEFAVGDEIYGCAGGFLSEQGALAEWMIADARLIAKKPKSLSMLETAALPLVAITAWEALFEKVHLTFGQKVLIHAGTGGVGHIAVQLARWAGADVYATVSSEEKAELAKSLGANDTIDYNKESVAEYVSRCTQGQGFDVIFDTVGGENLKKSIEAVNMYGNIVCISARSTYELAPLQAKSASLHTVFMLLPLLFNVQRERHGAILRHVATLVDNGYLRPLIDPYQFSLADVGKAHAHLETGKAVGKVVVAL